MKENAERNYEGSGLILLQDCVLSLLSSLLSILIIRWLTSPIAGFTPLVMVWLGSALAGTLAGSLLSGSHRVVRRWATLRSSSRLVQTVLVKEAVLVLCLLAGWVRLPETALCVLAVLMDSLLSFAALVYIRFAARMFSKSEVQRVKHTASLRNALVYGTTAESVTLARELRKGDEYSVVGFVSEDPSMAGRVLDDTVVYHCAAPQDVERLEWRLGGVDCIFIPRQHPATLDDGDTVNGASGGGEAVPDGMSRVGQVLKRTFDVGLSGVLMVLFSPLALLSAIAVKLEDGGPVLYRQERVGRGGKPFHILKFRSMRTDAEAAGARLYSGEGDPRLTRVGAFLRQHHLDELPQLWNVFRGDMSFIGYRPEREVYIRQIMERNPRYRYLYQIRPGVTSYATLYNGYTDTLEKMLTRLDLDLYYLRNHSVLFDLRVLGLTFLSIVSGKKF